MKKTKKQNSKGKNPTELPKFLSTFATSLANFGIGKERDYFVENLAMLLTAGMDILKALESIKVEMKTMRMKSVIEKMKKEIEEGEPLWKSLQNTQLFPLHVVSLIKTGEETGTLPQNLKTVVAQEQKQRVFRAKVRSAMMYPMIVLIVAIIAGIGIGWFLLPRLSVAFSSLNVELPLMTKMMISIGMFLGKYGVIVFPVILTTIIITVYFCFFFSKTKFIGQFFLFQFPGIGDLIREAELARLGFIFGTLMNAGLPVIQSLKSMRAATNFYSYQNFYDHLASNIDAGNSFLKSFENYPKLEKLIPSPMQQMIIASSESGHLSETLLKIGQIYEEKSEITTKNLSIILEPILLLMVWVIVFFIALAVVVPLYTLIGSI